MNEMQALLLRVTKLERELKTWRLISLLLIIPLTVAAGWNPAGDKPREIQLTSEDGRLKTSLSPYGLKFTWDGREIAGLNIETIGDGDRHAGRIKFSSTDDSKSTLSEEGLMIQSSDPYQRSITVRGSKGETAITPLGVMVPGGRFGVDQDGLVGLDMLDQNKLIASIGATGRFIHTVPPKRDSAALLLNDFGPDGKSHFITPSEAVVRGKAKDPKKP